MVGIILRMFKIKKREIIKNSAMKSANIIEVHQFKKEFLDKFENAEKYAVMNAKTFEKCTEYKKSKIHDSNKLEGLLRISNPFTKKSIYRKYRYDKSVMDNQIRLSLTARSELGIEWNKDANRNVSVEKANWFCYYWHNSDSSIRMPFRLTVLALSCSVLSVMPLLFNFISCVFVFCCKVVTCLY